MFSKHVNQNYNTADVFAKVNKVNHQIPSGWLLRMGCCCEWTNQQFSATSRHELKPHGSMVWERMYLKPHCSRGLGAITF